MVTTFTVSRALAGAASLLMVCALVSLATAEDTPAAAEAVEVVPDRMQWVEALASSDYRERAQAQRDLLRDNTIELHDLEALFEHARTLEQHHRLMDIARHHVARLYAREQYDQPGPGSLGIAHETVREHGIAEWRRPAVRVLRTLVGLPGYAVLEPGDLILVFEDQWLPADATRTHFGQMITGYEMGDTVDMTVYRNGELLELEVQLASGAALKQMFDAHTMRLTKELQRHWLDQRSSFAAHQPELTRLTAEFDATQTADPKQTPQRSRFRMLHQPVKP